MRRLVGIIAAALPIGGLVLIALWLIGRLFSDRFYLTQFLFWIPTMMAVVVALIGTVMASLLGRAASPPGERPRATACMATYLVGTLVAIWMVVFEWRSFAPDPPPPSAKTLRVVFWNPSWGSVPVLPNVVARLSPDVLVIGDQPSHIPWQDVRETFAPARAGLWTMNSVMMSKHRIIRWGGSWLGVEGVRPQTRVRDGVEFSSVQVGRGYWFELDTAEAFGRNVIIWMLDMPSDPLNSRWNAGQRALQTIRDWPGPELIRDAKGLDHPHDLAAKGFPAPDLIIGDFNAPRGSASIRDLTLGYPSAFDQAGKGPAGTYHRIVPLWHLDQAFSGPGVRVTKYRVEDPGEGRHLLQLVEFERVR